MKKMLYLSSALVVLGSVPSVASVSNHNHFRGCFEGCDRIITACCEQTRLCFGGSNEKPTDERNKSGSGVEAQHMSSRGDIKTIWDIGGIRSYKGELNDLVINLGNLESLYTTLCLDERNKRVLELFTGGIVLSDVPLLPGWAFNSDQNGKLKLLLQSLSNASSFRLEVRKESGVKGNPQRRGSLQGEKTLGEEIYTIIQHFVQLENLDLSDCELTNVDFEEILRKYNKQKGRLEHLKSIELKRGLDYRKEDGILIFEFENEDLSSILVRAQKEKRLEIKIIGSTKASYSFDSQATHSPMAGLVDTDSQLTVSAMASVDGDRRVDSPRSLRLVPEMKESDVGSATAVIVKSDEDQEHLPENPLLTLMTRSVEEKREFLIESGLGGILFGVESFNKMKTGSVKLLLNGLYKEKSVMEIESYFSVLLKISEIKQLEEMLDQLQKLAVEDGNYIISREIDTFRTVSMSPNERQVLRMKIFDFKKLMKYSGKYKQNPQDVINLDDCQVIPMQEISMNSEDFHMLLLRENIYSLLNMHQGTFPLFMLMRSCFDHLDETEKGKKYRIALSFVKMKEAEQHAAKMLEYTARMPEYLDHMRSQYAPKAVELFQETVASGNIAEIEKLFVKYKIPR